MVMVLTRAKLLEILAGHPVLVELTKVTVNIYVGNLFENYLFVLYGISLAQPSKGDPKALRRSSTETGHSQAQEGQFQAFCQLLISRTARPATACSTSLKLVSGHLLACPI
eukprot:1510969-Amphidinium_carterae.1